MVGGRREEGEDGAARSVKNIQARDGDEWDKVQGGIMGAGGPVSTLSWSGECEGRGCHGEQGKCKWVGVVTKGMEIRERMTGVGEWRSTRGWGRSDVGIMDATAGWKKLCFPRTVTKRMRDRRFDGFTALGEERGDKRMPRGTGRNLFVV